MTVLEKHLCVHRIGFYSCEQSKNQQSSKLITDLIIQFIDMEKIFVNFSRLFQHKMILFEENEKFILKNLSLWKIFPFNILKSLFTRALSGNLLKM